MLTDKKFLIFIVKFLLLFFFLYYGTIAIIGLAAPGRYYSPFIQQYFDYVSWIKISLMKGIKFTLSLFDIATQIKPGFVINIVNGRGVLIAMDCVGYGVYSFWIAFVVANPGGFNQKIAWVAGGLLLLWFINTIRISLFLVAINRAWDMPFGINHHTWFNIAAYAAIFVMIGFKDKWFTEKKHLEV